MTGILLIALLGAATPADCETLKGAVLRDKCELRQSVEQIPEAQCENPNTQLDMNICSYRDYLESDIELNQTWSRIKRTFDREPRQFSGQTDFGSLLEAQRAWLVYREKQCNAEAVAYEGGSMQPTVESTCLARVTRARTEELKALSEYN